MSGRCTLTSTATAHTMACCFAGGCIHKSAVLRAGVRAIGKLTFCDLTMSVIGQSEG